MQLDIHNIDTVVVTYYHLNSRYAPIWLLKRVEAGYVWETLLPYASDIKRVGS